MQNLKKFLWELADVLDELKEAKEDGKTTWKERKDIFFEALDLRKVELKEMIEELAKLTEDQKEEISALFYSERAYDSIEIAENRLKGLMYIAQGAAIYIRG